MALIDALANKGSAANTTAYQRWAYAVNDWIENGNGSQEQLYDLWLATGEPLGSALSRWALAVSLDGDPTLCSELARLLEQKESIPGEGWVDDVNHETRSPPH
jgi:hypothetical protein